MKRGVLFVLALVILMSGCQEKQVEVPVTPVGKINLYLLNAAGGVESLTLSINAMGVHTGDYDSWGVTYGKTTDRTKATDLIVGGKPSDGRKDIIRSVALVLSVVFPYVTPQES